MILLKRSVDHRGERRATGARQARRRNSPTPGSTRACRGSSSSLMHAADQGHEACARALLQAGANTELRNKHGETASQVAKARQHHVLAAMIEQHARNRKAQKQALAHTAREIAAVRAQTVAVRAQAAQMAVHRLVLKCL